MPKTASKKSKTKNILLPRESLQTYRISSEPLIMTYDSGIDIDTESIVMNHDRWQKSLGWDFDASKSNESDWRRSSTWYDMNHELRKVAQKIVLLATEASGIQFDIRQAETTQLTRYGIGEYYKPHNDHFNFPWRPNTTHNDRIATIIWYVNDDFEGGETYFNNIGLSIKPQRGKCLFFYYPGKGAHDLLLHEGRPVTKGEKTIASIWLRASPWP